MSEDQIQQQIVIYFRNYIKGMIFSVPNGGSRNVAEAKKLKNTGLLPGVADLIILLPNAQTIFIEVKTDKGKQSEVQHIFEKNVSQMGFKYFLVKNLEDFKNIFDLLLHISK
jgi:hypothetical protein